jgi:hypothetical protein
MVVSIERRICSFLSMSASGLLARLERRAGSIGLSACCVRVVAIVFAE